MIFSLEPHCKQPIRHSSVFNITAESLKRIGKSLFNANQHDVVEVLVLVTGELSKPSADACKVKLELFPEPFLGNFILGS